MDKKTKAQRGLVICPLSLSYYMADLRFEPRQTDSKAYTSNLYALKHPVGISWTRKRGKVFRAQRQAIAKLQNLERAQQGGEEELQEHRAKHGSLGGM